MKVVYVSVGLDVGVDILSQPLGVEYGLALSCPMNSITTVCFVSANPLITVTSAMLGVSKLDCFVNLYVC